MIPRLAALSIAEMSARSSSAAGLPATRIRLWSVCSRVRTLLLWSERAIDCRARLVADFVFAIG